MVVLQQSKEGYPVSRPGFRDWGESSGFYDPGVAESGVKQISPLSPRCTLSVRLFWSPMVGVVTERVFRLHSEVLFIRWQVLGRGPVYWVSKTGLTLCRNCCHWDFERSFLIEIYLISFQGWITQRLVTSKIIVCEFSLFDFRIVDQMVSFGLCLYWSSSGLPYPVWSFWPVFLLECFLVCKLT